MGNVWIKVEYAAWLSNWTAELTLAERGAVVTLWSMLKAIGNNGGVLPLDKLTAKTKQIWGIVDDPAWDTMLAKAQKARAVKITKSAITVYGWSKHQSDSTNTERQQRFRDSRKALRNVSNGNNDERDREIEREKETKKETAGVLSKPSQAPQTTKRPEFPKLLARYPALSAAGGFVNAWDEWLQHRREIHKSVTASTARRQLDKLAKAGPVVAVAMIEQSISQGWQGLFELKTKYGKQRTPEPRPLSPRSAKAVPKVSQAEIDNRKTITEQVRAQWPRGSPLKQSIAVSAVLAGASVENAIAKSKG